MNSNGAPLCVTQDAPQFELVTVTVSVSLR
jgi:hypothetical protein